MAAAAPRVSVDEAAAAAGAQKIVDSLGVKIEQNFRAFLEKFREEGASEHFYVEQIKALTLQHRSTVYVEYVHMQTFNNVLAETIAREYYRYEPFLRNAVLQVVRRVDEAYARDGTHSFKDFWVAIMNVPALHKIRDLKTSKIGALISISGTVTRTSEVRPELISATFACMECGTVVRNVDQQFKYTEPSICTNESCGNRSRWELNVEQSKFSDWQRVRVQENSNEIPAGAMPRSLDVILRNQIVDKAKPGDKAVFNGTLIVVPDVSQLGNAAGRVETRSSGNRGGDGMAQEGTSGLRMLGVRELTYKLCFLANMVESPESRLNLLNVREDADGAMSVEDVASSFSPQEREELLRMRSMPNLEEALVSSVAPNVYGHESIKRAVLLMLFGGVHKRAAGGVNLRGDINVCIVGDPSTAKSQFLKYVVSFLPRAIYTSGKASSAAGLTASVVKDDETGEFTIEAGALMLADNGVCCIDEFDKMDIVDQVAIHEAMEQQTISIAKAGIQATLNARTSILAAANPQGGRYDQRFSLKHNVDMSPAIMSRFDLFFVIIDECDPTADFNIAKHIVEVHRKADKAVRPEFSTEQLQRYIKFSRILKPKIGKESAELLVKYYRQLRQSDAGGVGKSSFRITVRQLESMVRLSEAMARLHMEDEVKPKYVEEAYRLLCKSIIHVETDDIDFTDAAERPTAGVRKDARGDGDDDDEGEDDLPPAPPGASASRASEGAAGDDAAAAKKEAVTTTLAQYRQITRMLVLHMRRSEEIEAKGIRRSELMGWYLEQIEASLTSEKALVAEQERIRRVIDHLTNRDRILIRLRNVDLDAAPSAGGEGAGEDDDPLLVVHANYVVD